MVSGPADCHLDEIERRLQQALADCTSEKQEAFTRVAFNVLRLKLLDIEITGRITDPELGNRFREYSRLAVETIKLQLKLVQ